VAASVGIVMAVAGVAVAVAAAVAVPVAEAVTALPFFNNIITIHTSKLNK
jgi:hypothetical protein